MSMNLREMMNHIAMVAGHTLKISWGHIIDNSYSRGSHFVTSEEKKNPAGFFSIHETLPYCMKIKALVAGMKNFEEGIVDFYSLRKSYGRPGRQCCSLETLALRVLIEHEIPSIEVFEDHFPIWKKITSN